MMDTKNRIEPGTFMNQISGKGFMKTLTGSASLETDREICGIVVEALPFSFTGTPVDKSGDGIPSDADQTISKSYTEADYQLPLYIDYLPNMTSVAQTEGTAVYLFA